jgi:hypothetical protein
MKIDFGFNLLTENSLSSLGKLIKEFNGLSQVCFRGNKKMLIQKNNTFFQHLI